MVKTNEEKLWTRIDGNLKRRYSRPEPSWWDEQVQVSHPLSFEDSQHLSDHDLSLLGYMGLKSIETLRTKYPHIDDTLQIPEIPLVQLRARVREDIRRCEIRARQWERDHHGDTNEYATGRAENLKGLLEEIDRRLLRPTHGGYDCPHCAGTGRLEYDPFPTEDGLCHG